MNPHDPRWLPLWLAQRQWRDGSRRSHPSMPPAGLAPGQSWIIPAGPLWQVRLDRGGRAHVVGQALAEHEDYRVGYADRGSPPRDGAVWFNWQDKTNEPAMVRRMTRPWHSFDRAHRVAAFHERMIVAAKRQGVA